MSFVSAFHKGELSSPEALLRETEIAFFFFFPNRLFPGLKYWENIELPR